MRTSSGSDFRLLAEAVSKFNLPKFELAGQRPYFIGE
jgi:hypothetical protein